ncbi:MAG: hypothetical protein QOC81_1728 [Thermoanaerobaculia bacterium]|jgi:hypothetical protein|nr:hypothetical protein [Thermoanaerobaculia bacterium]
MMWPVIRNVVALAVVALFASTSLADQPSREQVTKPLYVLGSHLVPGASTPFSGLLRFDVATKSYSPFASLQWGTYSGLPVDGATRLGATADRIVLQGADYFEFDVASGRLLRRYESNDSSSDGVAFHGAIVTEEQAHALGIPSGTYGFQSCTYSSGITGPSPIFLGCPSWTPTTPYSLFRRSLDPTDRSLLQVKPMPQSSIAVIALDPPHRQFWLRTLDTEPRWTTLPITNGVIGDPTPASLTITQNRIYSLTYHDPTRSLFELFKLPDHSQILQQQSTVDSTTATTVMQPLIASMTAVPELLPERYLQLIPAIGEAPGTNGTFWHSDLWLYNPASDAVDVTLRRVARPDITIMVRLAAHGSLAMRDVLKTLGGGPAGDGVTTDALVIDAPYRWGAQLAAYSRTYTSAPDGGTYGQSVPAVPSAVGYSNHVRDFRSPSDVSGFPSTIVLDKRDVSRFRHNLGVVNDSDTAFDIRLYDGFTKFSRTIAAHSVGTVNLESVFTDSNGVLFAADRPAPVWLSMVDNISGDATFVPFTNLSTIAETEGEMAIPAVGSTHGVNGTSWRTDLYGSFPTIVAGETLGSPLAHLDASTGCTADTHLNVDGVFIFRDVAGQFGPCAPGGTVTGAMRMRGSSWMQGFSRTYTTRPDGGTLGDMLPFYPQNGWPLQHFSGIEAGGRFRINVGLYNGQSVTTTNRLLLYDAAGALVAQRDIDLGPHASLQSPLASLMNVANLPAGLYGLSIIPTGDGRSWAYVSLVDNISGDPTNLW